MKKAKGPFRTGALVPSIILLALVWAYFFFFFDHHLKAGMEFGLTRVNGAEVDIASLNTSFWHANMGIYGLEVTDKEKPEQNTVKIGTIRFAMLWDALLRGKIAIQDASILDIQPYVMRIKPGYVLPPPPPQAPGILAKVQDQVVQQTRAKFNGNFLGDIADVVGGMDPKDQLKNLQGDLKSQARAMELEKELTAKKAEWEKKIKDMPKPAEIQAIEAKIKALNMNSKNPMEIAKSLKQAKEILGEAQGKINQVNQTQSQLTGDILKYTAATADLEKLAAQDVSDLQKRLKIPSIDPKEFSTQLFMAQIEKHLTGVRKYIAIARKYMPSKKSSAQLAAEKKAAKENELLPPARGKGVTYHFPITTAYPLFWLKKAAISSELSQSDWAGKVSGELLDVTTSPTELGRPTKLHLAGDFPKQKIAGLDFLATLDHTTDKAKDSITAKVAAFPVTNQIFSDSPSVKFGIKQATAAASMSATLADEALNIKMGSRFDKPEFDFEAKSAPVKEILGAVLKGISTVTMDASVTGSWDKFNIDIDSNLGRELSGGFQKQLQAKLGEAKAKLDGFVNEKIGGNKKKVQELLSGLTSGPGKLLGQNKAELDKAMSSAEKSAQGGGAGAPAGGAKKLLKGFGF
ncbi:MAG: TIGR03545 family protein [Bdellovibrionota bacterium]